MKISVVFHSETGNTKSVAELMTNTINKMKGVSAKAMDINDIDIDYLNESCAVLFGCPTYAGSLSWQMKKFIDTFRIKLGDKLGGVFATANFFGGGSEFTEMVLVSALLSRGMLVYSAGVSQGHPFTHFGVVSIKDGDDAQKKRIEEFAIRFADKAKVVFCK